MLMSETVEKLGAKLLRAVPRRYVTQPQSDLSLMNSPMIGADGRITLPGSPLGLSAEAYLPLVHLYTRVLEASRILDRYRAVLRLPPPAVGLLGPDQAPLTALEPSRRLPNLYYKREDQTVTRAYKVRGAVVGMAKAMELQQAKRFLAVSTGNHALGVLKAAELLCPESVRIAVPKNTAPVKLHKIQAAVDTLAAKGIQASVVPVGDTFDEAREWAMAQADSEYYLDPYNDPWVVAGQGTLGLELVQQVRALLAQSNAEEVVLISPVGGGGLLSGTATALRMASLWDEAFRTVDLRFVGLGLSNPHAELGDAIRVRQLAPANSALLRTLKIPTLGMDDPQMREGVAFVADDLGVAVEGASGGTLYPVLHRHSCQPSEKRLVISLLSGGNTSQ